MTDNQIPGETFLIRELAPEQDLPGWLELIHALEMEQTGQAHSTEEQLHKALLRQRRKRWVVADPDHPRRLIAVGVLYAQIKERCELDLNVHPAWRRRGVGSRLLVQMVEEARSIGAAWANCEIDEKNTTGIAFLRQHSFQPFSDAWLLRAPAEQEFREPVWPAGYRVRSLAEVNSMAACAEAANHGYGDMWGHEENTAGGIDEAHVGRYLSLFDPQDVFLLYSPADIPLGLTRVEPVSRTGAAEDVLDAPGVAPDLRRLHLQRELALHALARLRSLGQHAVRLESWGDTTETVRLYEEIGFRVVEHFLAYRKAL